MLILYSNLDSVRGTGNKLCRHLGGVQRGAPSVAALDDIMSVLGTVGRGAGLPGASGKCCIVGKHPPWLPEETSAPVHGPHPIPASIDVHIVHRVLTTTKPCLQPPKLRNMPPL
jgi:hypothetical protein